MSARGCTYVVPAADYGLALRVGQPFWASSMRTARTLGVTDQEVDRLCGAVLRALGTEAMKPAALRDATAGYVRSLGEAGKKKGITTTLPLALGWLQGQGEIRRIPTEGRLDQQRYAYARWTPPPDTSLSLEEAHEQLARRYFGWVAPARLSAFRWFSGLGVRDSRRAVASLGLVSLAEEPDNDPRLLFPAQKEAFYTQEDVPSSDPVLLGSLDALFLLRRDLSAFLDTATQRQLLGGGDVTSAGRLSDLPYHAIVDAGRLVGVWEYDPVEQAVVWVSFEDFDDCLVAAVSRTEAYIKEQVGDARAYSLDSAKRRGPRLASLRAL